MSRLESMRRRLTAQIDALNWAVAEVSGMTGDALEIGLGNGRTYDHLRENMPDRRIWVIDRQMDAHPSCVPPAQDFLQGEADAMLQEMARRGIRLAMAHYELGIGVPDKDVALAAQLSPLLIPLMMPGGIVVSQEPMPGFTRIDGPSTVTGDRYFVFRA